MAIAQDIVAKLWNLCNILREGGITYPEYVTELTYLIFLKMAEETGTESDLPLGLRWRDLATKAGETQFKFYEMQLKKLGVARAKNVRSIFAGAESALPQAKFLGLLVQEFDRINWYNAREEAVLADLYEGLLEKNSAESKSGAGQYFTPRPLIESIIDLVKPLPGETIQDPACGTAGFLIAADRYIKRATKNFKTLSPKQAAFQREHAFYGVELVQKTCKLALMNAMLHGIEAQIVCGDALGKEGEAMPPAEIIVTNPPFGTKPGAGLPDRAFPFPTSNKQLAFLQHIYLSLKPGGRAAIVLPDLQGSLAQKVLQDLMEKCGLHTVLRLPTGIFYAQGVKTNVYFFTRGKTDKDNTKDVWIYDLRSNMPTFNKGNPLTRTHFAEFEKAFGSDPYGKSKRRDEGGKGRFRRFSRNQIREQGDTLDISWLVDGEVTGSKTSQSPDALANEIMKRLQNALKELKALQSDTKLKN
ncbi:MAG TPA: N-6 DNA methylase [Verrucomicrobiae bacterium]|jgi:type I restriction enzyme M protein|nr:N-6 DNA methylase [Verrucomicrobiae bacterium]